jgi:tetratricopeptide (TPR) repeat protein
MKYPIIFILAFILTSCVFKSAKDYFDEAAKLEEQEKYSEAIILLDKAIEKQPEFIGAIINRGADKSALKKYDEAIKDYQLVLNIDKKNTLAVFNIANNKKRLKDYKSAITYYDQALDTKGGQYLTIDWVDNPNFPDDKAAFDVNTFDIVYQRGLAYYELDSLNKAASDFNNCIKNNSNIVDATFFLSQTYFKASRMTDGCEYLSKAIQLGYKDYLPEQLKLCDK